MNQFGYNLKKLDSDHCSRSLLTQQQLKKTERKKNEMETKKSKIPNVSLL